MVDTPVMVFFRNDRIKREIWMAKMVGREARMASRSIGQVSAKCGAAIEKYCLGSLE
jgi:hypothetical protein